MSPERNPKQRWKVKRRALAGLLLAACVAVPWVGAQGQPITRPIERMQEQEPQLPQEAAAEVSVEFPSFPRGEDLVELGPGRFEHGVRVFLDPDALSQPAPGVVRYTMLLISATGSGNLFYESINCDRKEWRTLAFGTREGTFEPMRQPRWRTLDAGAGTGHRRALARNYICILGRRLPNRAEDLRHRLLGPDANSNSEFGTRWNR